MKGILSLPGIALRKSDFVSPSVMFRTLGILSIMISQVVIARLMGGKAFGDYAVMISSVNIVLVVCAAGMTSVVRNRLPVMLGEGDLSGARGLMKFSFRLTAFSSALIAAGLLTMLIAYARNFNISFSEGVFWSIFLLPVFLLMDSFNAVLAGFRKFKASQLTSYFILPLVVSAGCLWYHNDHGRLTIDAVMAIYLSCAIFICIYLYRKISIYTRERTGDAEPKYRSLQWLRLGMQAFPSGLLNVLLLNAGTIMVAVMEANSMAGKYFILSLIFFLSIPWMHVKETAGAPVNTDGSAFGEHKRRAVMNSLLRIFFFAVTGGIILSFFGDGFSDAYPALLLMLVMNILVLPAACSWQALFYSNQRSKFLVTGFFCVIMMIALQYFLVPVYGLTGAALSTGTSILVLNYTGMVWAGKQTAV